MQKSYLSELANYNQWANHMVCSWLDTLSEDQWKREVISSFNSIEATSLHIIGAEKIWLQRLRNHPSPEWYPSVFKGNKGNAIQDWKDASEGLLAWVNILEEEEIMKDLTYKRLNGETYQLTVYKVISHVFMHSAYHRGQLVTQLRQAGFQDLTTTDLLAFYHKNF